MNVKIAAAQYDIGFHANWFSYQRKIEHWVSQACDQGAKILLFPEYASMELASIFGKPVYSQLNKQLEAMQSLLNDYLDLYKNLAQQHNCYIQAGTYPVAIADKDYRNRAFLFMPNGEYDFQDKLIMTRFENEQWLIKPGTEIKCFDTDYGKIAINVCYDSEFPLIARKQVEMGANLILVPSCTDTLAGYYRVRIGCQARALENQCYVVQSPTIGNAEWSEAVDANIGAAAIYTPVDSELSENGILNIGRLNTSQWVYAELSFSAIEKVRNEGQVFNYRDWPRQQTLL